MKIIKSTRFQALVALAILYIVNDYYMIDTEVLLGLQTILWGHISIRTVDRLGEKVGGGTIK